MYPTKTRIVLDLSGAVDFRTFTLPRPWRVVIDMSEVTWSPHLKRAPHGGLVTGMRFGLFKPGTSRVVMDAKGPVQVIKSFLLPPSSSSHRYRLVLDVARTTAADFARTYRRPSPRVPVPRRRPASAAETASVAVPLPKMKPDRPPALHPEKKLIMIDPGHGGIDPGAISPSGVEEKNVVLAFGKVLRRALLRTGNFRVAMTRDTDVFVPLRERVEMARKAHADLFISIHANIIGNRHIHGTLVYTLSETASDKEAAALAAKENKSDVIAGVDLSRQPSEVGNILIDLAQRETMNESAVFAKILVDKLSRFRFMLNNTHRFAGFVVLKAPDVPSVLVELGYLSNRGDVRLLESPAWRRKMAAAMTNAIEVYFGRQQALNGP